MSEEEEEEDVIRWPDEGSSFNEYDGIGEAEIPRKAMEAASAEEEEKQERINAFAKLWAAGPIFSAPAGGTGAGPGSRARSQGKTGSTYLVGAEPALTTHDVIAEGDNPARVTCELDAPIYAQAKPVAMTRAVQGAAELRVLLGPRWQGCSEIFAISAAQIHSIRAGVQACALGSAYGYVTSPGSVVVGGTTHPYLGPSTCTLRAGHEVRLQLIPAGASGRQVVFSVRDGATGKVSLLHADEQCPPLLLAPGQAPVRMGVVFSGDDVAGDCCTLTLVADS